MRGQKQDSERRMIMTLKKDVREQWASKSPEGKPIQFIKPLAEAEQRDYIEAKKITDARQAQNDYEEAENEANRHLMLKETQLENFQHLKQKQSLSVREKKVIAIKEDGNYYTSVKLPDTVNGFEPQNEQKKRLTKDLTKVLKEQMQHKKVQKKEEEKKFFGMTDEEILMNKDVFKQMGLL